MGRFKFQFCWREWWLPDFWRAGTSTTKGHAKPDFSFCPCNGALSDKAPGIPALTAPLGTTWRLSRLATAKPATKIGLHPSLISHVASCSLRQSSAYKGSRAKISPHPGHVYESLLWTLRYLALQRLALMPVVCRCAKRRGIRCKDSICYTIRVIPQGGKGGRSAAAVPSPRSSQSCLASYFSLGQP
jgi:hypothetical protein